MSTCHRSYSLAACLLVCLSSGSSALAGEFDKISTKQLIEDAMHESKHVHWQRAIVICDEILKRNPTNVVAHHTKASCLEFLVGPRESIKYLEPVTKKYPNNAKLLSELGVYYTTAGAYNQAVATFSRAIKLHPTDYENYHDRSIALSFLKRYGEAASDMTNYLKFHPGHARGYQWRADAYKQLGQWDKAIADLGQAIILGKNQAAEFRLQRAELYMNLKDYKKALADYDSVLKENPIDDTVWYKKGQVLVWLKDYNSALKAFTEAIELSDSSTAYYARSDVYEKLKDHSAALKDRAMGDKLARQRAVERL